MKKIAALRDLLANVTLIDVMPPHLTYHVPIEQRLTIRCQNDLTATDHARLCVDWYEKNLVIRNNFAPLLKRLDICASSNIVKLTAVARAFDRTGFLDRSDDGRVDVISQQQFDAFRSNYTPEFLMMCVRTLLRDVLLHELDECLVVDGRIFNDPHRNDP